MAKESPSSGGIGFLGILTILFIGLKLTGYIDWSWVWILSPLWVPVLICLMIVGFTMMIVLMMDRTDVKQEDGEQ